MLKDLRDEIVKITKTPCAHLLTDTKNIDEDLKLHYDSHIVFYFPYNLTQESMEFIFRACKNHKCDMTFHGKSNGKAHAVIKPRQ